MKNVVLILLALAVVGLFLHSKRLSDDLDKAEDDNSHLTDQVSTYQTENADLQTKLRQLQPAAGATSAFPGNEPHSALGSEPNPLDKPPYH